jgi:hypothetical protein
MVRSKIAIEQMTVHPVCPNAPMDMPQMYQIAGEPHPRVVMQIACLIQTGNGLINDCKACAALKNIGRHVGGIAYAGEGRAKIGKDPTAFTPPDMVKKSAPGELGKKFVVGS